MGVIGAGGYAGIELVRRLSMHPYFNLCVITDNHYAGKRISDVYPAFRGVTDLTFKPRTTPDIKDMDIVFLAVPHTASLKITPNLLDAGITVIDLSADYRLKDPTTYAEWYGVEHTSPELLTKAAFGLPEITGDQLQAAAHTFADHSPALIGCAGCYPTATSLAAYPAISSGLTCGPVVVSAMSGVTGAGKTPSARTHFCSADENIEAYKPGHHRHTPEIEQILGIHNRVVFTPHLVPAKRGLLSTVTMHIADAAASHVSLEKIHQSYVDFYRESPFVSVLKAGDLPKTSSVVGTNNAHIGLSYDMRTHSLIAVCAIDNLEKGAAGQAVQCANIVCGFSQATGFSDIAMPV